MKTTHAYTTTLSGVNVGPPGIFSVNDVNVSDIRRSLAKLCRFNGHVERFYSVAEHSVLVSKIAEAMNDAEAIVPALFHDAHEAYFGDYASPVKQMIPGIREFELGMELTVREALYLPGPDDDVWDRVRLYDQRILHRELKTLRRTLPDWYNPIEEALVPASVVVNGFDWQEAESLFRNRMRDLGIGLGGNS